ncbi:MAG: STM4014 family protein [Rivularia sp. (in: cyanobacteria)]
MQNLTIIANPENRRVGLLQKAIANLNLPPATVISYADLITGKQNLEVTPNNIIRFDSPEKNFDVDKAIIAVGDLREGEEGEEINNYQRISSEDVEKLEFDKGRILYPRQWYLGWRNLLLRWEKNLTPSPSPCLRRGEKNLTTESSPCLSRGEKNLTTKSSPCLSRGGLEVMNHPGDIAVMFDKPRCHERFSKNNVPVARSLGKIHNYEHLRQQMQSQGLERVFIKLSHGSSASGVIAYRANSRFESAITTVERVREDGETLLYNSRRIRNYTKREEIADIINILTAEGVIVEEWLPKARLQGCGFDLRVVVIDGEAQHTVVRLGKSPMTNLHLGNERGDINDFLDKVGEQNWQKMKQTCEQAAALFPNSLYCGVDLMILPDWEQHAVLEINAFGDLLPGITHRGLSTYESELKAVFDK